jgi:hypothetical protein
LRAGPLSDATVVHYLNANYINTWVLKPTLPILRDKAATAETRRLATAVLGAKQPASPVDCLVLTPDCQVIAVRPVHELLSGRVGDGLVVKYHAFLAGALEKANSKNQ